MESFEAFFHRSTGNYPHPWQKELGENAGFAHRLIRIPTGLGKTDGVVLSWAYHRCVRGELCWPTIGLLFADEGRS